MSTHFVTDNFSAITVTNKDSTDEKIKEIVIYQITSNLKNLLCSSDQLFDLVYFSNTYKLSFFPDLPFVARGSDVVASDSFHGMRKKSDSEVKLRTNRA